MDEPFAALDEITRQRLNGDLLAWWQSAGLAVLFVTHSVFEAVFLSQRVLVMSARPGRIAAEVLIDEPFPRTAEFRSSLRYAQACREVLSRLRQPTQLPWGSRCDGAGVVSEGISPAGSLRTGLAAWGSVCALVGWLLAWEALVRLAEIPHYTLPAPSLVLMTLFDNFSSLAASWWFTLKITVFALLLAIAGGC